MRRRYKRNYKRKRTNSYNRRYFNRRLALYRPITRRRGNPYNNQFLCLKIQGNFDYNQFDDTASGQSDYVWLRREFNWSMIRDSTDWSYMNGLYTSFTPIRMTVVWSPGSMLHNSDNLIFNDLGPSGQVISTYTYKFNTFDGYSVIGYDVYDPTDPGQDTSVQVNNHYFREFSIYKRSKRRCYPRLGQVSNNKRQTIVQWNTLSWVNSAEQIFSALGRLWFNVKLTYSNFNGTGSSDGFNTFLNRVRDQLGHFWVYFFVKFHDRR